MLKQGDILYQKQQLCAYFNESQTYQAHVTLINTTDQHIHLYPVCSFGVFAKEHSQVRSIPPKGEVTLNYTLKSTNIISQLEESIVIFASTLQIGELIALQSALKMDIELRFTQQFVNDPLIEEIVNEQVRNLLKVGEGLQAKEQWKQARHTYQQAFQLLRKNSESLYHMARCSYKLKQYQPAMRDISTAIILDNHARYRLFKVKLIYEWLASQSKGVYVMEECDAILRDLRKSFMDDLSQNQRGELGYYLGQVFTHYQAARTGAIKRELIQKALDGFDKQVGLVSYYKTSQQFQKTINGLLKQDKQSQKKATPQQVIDPINYQIMNEPYILPSGNSCQKNSLIRYFQTNGYKDPILRKEIRPEWVFPNHSLRDYIKGNRDLKKWQQYQYETVFK